MTPSTRNTLLATAMALLGAGCASTPDNVGGDTSGLYYWGKDYFAVPQDYRIRCRSRQLTVFKPNGETLSGEAGIGHLTSQTATAVNSSAVDGQPIIRLSRSHCGHARGRYGRLPILVNGGLGFGPGRANVRTNVNTGRINTGVRVNTRVPKL